MRLRPVLLLLLLLSLVAGTAPRAQDVPNETYTLPNGLTVILHEDHKLPQVTINTWFGVGSKDEAPGRSGFAHLFEHLMFMGTARVPEGQFDQIMESGGGANNASTGSDRTNYYSWGPSSLLPTLLWLDADRMEGLGKAMTQEKLDLQRSVVRNERRQGVENTPYGVAELEIADALYPAGHPYAHTVIGSHEDLEAATLTDVKAFFATFYVPSNASLVVAGDFDPAVVKPLIAQTFGAVPAGTAPSHFAPPPAPLSREVRRRMEDRVQFPKLYLVWPSPARYADGHAAMDFAASLLSEGGSGRLHKRLVLQERLAQSVDVYQDSRELGSEFHIEVTAAEGADLERIKRSVLGELERFKAEGPAEAEVARVMASSESAFLRRMEDLGRRADMLNGYYHYFGVADGFRRDIERYRKTTAAEIREWSQRVLGDGRLDLRVLPRGEAPVATPSARPADFPPTAVTPPLPKEMTLGNGLRVVYVQRPGTGLFSGTLVFPGGERTVPAEKAGLSALAATLLTKGAGSRDASAFADAVASLGARLSARSDWVALRVQVSGLSSKIDPTLDLFADAVLRPSLTEQDFLRERQLALEAIRARAEEPAAVAQVVSKALLFGKEDPRGRPAEGYAKSVESLTRDDVVRLLPRLLGAGGATFVFVGDFEPEALRAALGKRFGGWKAGVGEAPPLPAPVARGKGGRLVLVDRPDAPQTLLWMARPLTTADEALRAQRECLNTLFGGSFTSRLNQNIREKHGFAYGARSSHSQEANQGVLMAYSPVQTAVTGAALTEFKREFDALASGDISREELEKARRSVRYDLVDTAATTASLGVFLSGLVADGRPLDEVQRLLAALDAVELEALNARARGGDYAWKDLLVVLVGDRSQILPQLKAAGFPEPQLVDIEGEPVVQ